MMSMRILTGVVSLALALAVGCDGDGGTDAGPGAGDGDVSLDAGAPTEAAPDPVAAFTEGASDFETAPLDLSCMGTRTAPTGGDAVQVEFRLRDFQDEFEVGGAEVHIFSNNIITDGCQAPNCESITTNEMGNGDVMLPAGGWYAYRVLPLMAGTGRRLDDVFQVFQYNEPIPAGAGGSVDGQSVSGVTIDLIPALLGFTRENGRAIIAGRVHDCNDANIANARVLAFDPDGRYLAPTDLASDAADYYFAGAVMGNVPNQLANETSPDGLYVYPQVEYLDDRPYRVEAWATVDGTFQRIGCETARIFTDSVTILNVGPMRADGAPECGE